jgi:hypothetical protein
MSFRSWYFGFVSVMGYSPSDPSVHDRGTSIWRISQNDNYYRKNDSETVRATVCVSKHGDIGYVWDINGDSGWTGPFDTFDDAMDHADEHVFGG